MTDLKTWTARPMPGNAPLEGWLVRLVALDPAAHSADLWAAFGGAASVAIWDYMPIGPFADAPSFRAGMEWIAARTDWVPFAILDRATGRAAGMASYMRIDAANGAAEVGCIAFGAGLKQRPAATEAMMLMAARIFEELGYRRYEWKCDSNNAPSRRAALRLGFTYEGIFRQHMVVKGRNRDTAWFAVIDAEWEAIRAGMENWLDDVNFDADGQQRRPLGTWIGTSA